MRMQEQSRALEPIYIPESLQLITFHTMVDTDNNNEKTFIGVNFVDFCGLLLPLKHREIAKRCPEYIAS